MGSVGSGEIYRANPAREIEQIAAVTVRAWLGPRGVLEDTSQGGGPDFWIKYHDRRQAVDMSGAPALSLRLILAAASLLSDERASSSSAPSR
jgi:hypothetical protein